MLPSCCWAAPAAPAAAASVAAAVLLPLPLPLLLPPRAPLRLSVAEPISFKTRSLRRKASRELCGVVCASAQPAAAERRLMVWPFSAFWRLECTVACLVDRGRVSCQHKSCPESRENHHCTGAPGCPTNQTTSDQPCPNPVGYVTIMHTPSGPTVAAQRRTSSCDERSSIIAWCHRHGHPAASSSDSYPLTPQDAWRTSQLWAASTRPHVRG